MLGTYSNKKIYNLDNLEISLFNDAPPKEQIFQEIKEGNACLQDTSFDNHLVELCSYKSGFKVIQYPLTREEKIDGMYSSYNEDFNEAFQEFLSWLEDVKEDIEADKKEDQEEVLGLFDF